VSTAWQGAASGDQARFRSLLETVPSMTFESDVTGANTYSSEQWCAYTGLTPEQSAGFGWAQAVHPDDIAGAAARWEQAVRQGVACEMRHRIRAADGSYRWFMLRARPVRDQAGRIERWAGSLTDVDDLLHTQNALRDSERRYRELVENANSAIIRWRRDGTLTFFNEYAERFFGYRASEVLGRNVGLLVPGLDSQGADLTQLVEDIVRNPTHYANNVNENICRDGRRVWMSWTNRPILDERGVVVEILAVGSDITERIRIEQALRESREDLNRAQAVGRIGSWRLDVRANVLTWSQENHRIFGIPEGTPMSYDTFLSLVHPEDRDFVDGRWKAALRGEAYDVEHRILKDGRVVWVRQRAELEFDPQGNLLGGFGTTQDVTDLKIAEKALRESEQRFQLASEIGRSGTWDWDVGSGSVVWTRGHFEILGYRLGEVQPSYAAWAERVHPDDRAGVEAEIRRTMAEHAEYAREFRVLWPDGSIHWMSAHARYEYGEDGACRRMVGVMADVTEIKEAEHRLRELNAELSVLLAERTRLADERAADLRALAAELIHAEQRERDRLYEVLHDHVQPLLVGARLRLSGLDRRTPVDTWMKSASAVREHISDALDTARSLSVELNPPLVRDHGLGAALDWLCRQVRGSHGLNVQLSCDAAAEPADAATRLMLFKAARELLMNVAKHAGAKEVSLVMERVAGPGVQITVADQGAGFDAAALATDPRRRSGTGLSNIERRLAMLGGRFEIASKPGAGSTVRLSVPLISEATESVPASHGTPGDRRSDDMESASQ
jgi:PAS domain S-box-containing protein